jgi:lambda family phage tail tape measure protein
MDIVSLLFKANTKALDDAEKKLAKVGDEAADAQGKLNQAGSAGESAGRGIASGSNLAASGVGKLTMAVKTLVAPLLAVMSVTKFIDVAREAEILNASLITATGSAEKAAEAMTALQDFASQTPYDLNQVVDGFNKLVNLGLTPSERALTAYGNTASALGKDLNQMIEAVADAATGEFERLKEFGIRSKKEGDNVTFTFRGVATTVKNNSREIEEYLTRLGEVEFAGAMEQRMNTLDGAISNLGDSFTKLVTSISNSGLGSVVASMVREVAGWFDWLGNFFTAGGFNAYMLALRAQWGNLFGDIAKVVSNIFNWIKSFSSTSVAETSDTWLMLPNRIRTAIGTGLAYLAEMVTKAQAYGKAIAEAVSAPLQSLTDGSFRSQITARLDARLKEAEQTRQRAVETLKTEEKNAQILLQAARVQAAAAVEFASASRVPTPSPGDRLAQYRVGADAPSTPTQSKPEQPKLREREYRGDFRDANAEAEYKSYEKYALATEKLLEERETREREIALAARRNAQEEYMALMQRIQGYRDLADPTLRYRDLLTQMNADYQTGKLDAESYASAVAKIKDAIAEVDESWKDGSFTDGMKQALGEVNRQLMTTAEMGKSAFTEFADRSSDAFADFVTTGKLNFKEFARSFLADIAKMIAKQLMLNALKSAFGGFFADGGAFSNGVQFFAKGGVVNRPTAFGMSGGRVGVMGEAGPEAIMPLKRGSDGKLGVVAQQSGPKNVSVHNNISVSIGSVDSAERQAELLREIQKTTEATTKRTLADQMRPGGMLYARA